MNKDYLKKLGILFVLWRVGLQLVAIISTRVISFDPSYPYVEFLSTYGPWWLVRWAGFDGVHYLTIAVKGYIGTGLIQAFFPVYPLLIRLLDILQNPIVTGIVLSHVFTFASLCVFVLLFKKEKLSIDHGLFSFILFPTAFFLATMYTESLFLFLVLSAFLAARKKQWLIAALFAMLCTGTRVIGIFLVPALLFEAYLSRDRKMHVSVWQSLPWKQWGVLIFGCIGVLLYMLFLQREFHDPLYFFHVQEEFNVGRQESLVVFPQVVYRYIKIFLSVQPMTLAYYTYVQEFILTMIVGAILILQTFSRQWKIRGSYLLYAWGAYLLPSITGTFQSMPRYILVIFPVFLFLARLSQRYPVIYKVVMVISVICLIINVMLFFQGRWVA